MSFDQQLNIYLRARFTLIVLMTPEEERGLARHSGRLRSRPTLLRDLGRGRWLPVADGRLGIACQPSKIPWPHSIKSRRWKPMPFSC